MNSTASKAEWAPLTDEELKAVNTYQAKLHAEWLAAVKARSNTSTS